MSSEPVYWSDDAEDAIAGDLVSAAAYITPAGGAVVTGVATCGLRSRWEGTVSFTTSLGLARKIEHLIRDPHAALAYHAREHGFATSPSFVLVQGIARVDLKPSLARLEPMIPAAERFLGPTRRGRIWDRVLHEYYWERVFVDVAVDRVITWGDLGSHGVPQASGLALPVPPDPQAPPANGTGPRTSVDKAARQVAKLPHRLLAYRSSDGYPTVVPVEVAGHDAAGLRLVAADGLLPPGGRRAGLLAHSFRAQVAGLRTRTFTGWLEVGADGDAVYAPHTSKGYFAPPLKALVLVFNGLYSKYGYRQALKHGVPERLERLLAERAGGAALRTP
jgi:hypothetical protein